MTDTKAVVLVLRRATIIAQTVRHQMEITVRAVNCPVDVPGIIQAETGHADRSDLHVLEIRALMEFAVRTPARDKLVFRGWAQQVIFNVPAVLLGKTWAVVEQVIRRNHLTSQPHAVTELIRRHPAFAMLKRELAVAVSVIQPVS